MWRMRDASLLWLLCSQNFKICLLPTYHLLCTCFHNNSILCKISHMQTILSSPLILLWWLGNMPSTFFELVFAKAYTYCYKIEWLFCEPQNFVSTVLDFLPFFHSAMPWVYIFYCCIWVLTCEFVGHLFWNGQFQGFNSPTSASVCYNLIWYVLQKSCLHFAMCVQVGTS
jgi:hypothetical protein